MPRDLVKDAVTVRKSLLGYMGDKQMSFPETLAQNILMKGLDKPKIRDEVYLQVSSLRRDGPARLLHAKEDTITSLLCFPSFSTCSCCLLSTFGQFFDESRRHPIFFLDVLLVLSFVLFFSIWSV